MPNFISKMFSTPEEFEAYLEALNNERHPNQEILNGIDNNLVQKWNDQICVAQIKDGKIQLLCETGKVIAEVPIGLEDGATICRNSETGAFCVEGFKEHNSAKTFKMWAGTQAEYDAIRVKDDSTYYWITDDATLSELEASLLSHATSLKALEDWRTKVTNGETSVHTAKEIETLTNNDTEDNANIVFTIGDKSFSKTINKVNKAKSLTDILPITLGGTGANNRRTALDNLAFLGLDPIASIEEDTADKWRQLGTGYAFFATAGRLNNQPQQYGTVISFVYENELFQIWKNSHDNYIHTRTGNYTGWLTTFDSTAKSATKLIPTTQEIAVDFRSGATPNISLNLELNKTYMLQVTINESFNDSNFGNVQGDIFSMSFTLAIPNEESLTRKYNTIHGYNEGVLGDISSTISNFNNTDYKFTVTYNNGNFVINFSKKVDNAWSNYVAAENSLELTRIKCVELF